MTTEVVYHERQVSQLCALHSVNNILQYESFQKKHFDDIMAAHSQNLEYSTSCNDGNSEVNVIMEALRQKNLETVWHNKQRPIRNLVPNNIFGFILNVQVPKDSAIPVLELKGQRRHWFAVRRVADTYLNLDSLLKAPSVIGDEESLVQFLEKEVKNKGSILLIVLQKETASSSTWYEETTSKKYKKDDEDYQENICPHKRNEAGASKKIKLISPVHCHQGEQDKKKLDNQIISDSMSSKTLFLKHLPGTLSVKDIFDLSPDITHVRIHMSARKFNLDVHGSGYAHIEFDSQEKRDKNFPILAAMSLRGIKLAVDYVGEESSLKNNKLKTIKDQCKLILRGIPFDIEQADLQKIFPQAKKIIIPKSEIDQINMGHAIVQFDNKNITKQSYERSQNLKMKGYDINVQYALKQTATKASKSN